MAKGGIEIPIIIHLWVNFPSVRPSFSLGRMPDSISFQPKSYLNRNEITTPYLSAWNPASSNLVILIQPKLPRHRPPHSEKLFSIFWPIPLILLQYFRMQSLQSLLMIILLKLNMSLWNRWRVRQVQWVLLFPIYSLLRRKRCPQRKNHIRAHGNQ